MEAVKHEIAPAHDGIRKLKETVGNNNRRAKGIQAITWLIEELDKFTINIINLIMYHRKPLLLLLGCRTSFIFMSTDNYFWLQTVK